MSLLPSGLSGGVAAYQISRSLRFNSADSAYLNRTPASASNRKTWTWSAWVKRSTLGAIQELFDGYWANTDNGYFWVGFTSADAFEVQLYNSTLRTTTQVFRDPSAWYHFVLAVDTTQATAANRVKVYANGSEITTFSTNNAPTQNLDTAVNYNGAHYIGTFSGTTNFFNGYQTEINLIDGQALTPSSFGQNNASTGVWEPIKYTGTYGTNGFYLNFSDNSNTTSTTLGKDSSGNGNNWTPNNFSVTAGAGNDSLVDTPTPYGTDTGAGGEVRGNYCTMNPLANTGIGTLSNGNLTLVTSTNTKTISGTMALPSTGQYYFEITATDYVTDGGTSFGLVNSSFLTGAPSNGSWLGFSTYSATYDNGTSTDTNNLTGTNVTQDGDIWCIAVDVTNGKFWIGRSRSGSLTWADGVTPAVNGSGATTLSLPSGTLYPMAYRGGSFNETYDFNFGQRAFAHTAPSGFKALCTQNLPTPTIGATATTRADDYFNTVLYTGTGSSLGVTGVGFQPDWVWIKERSGAADHGLYDAVRGVQKQLESNNTDVETTETTGLTAFNSDGFTVGALAQLNTNTDTYVAWNWKANGAGSSNTSGTITSTVSANTTAGFSIVSYTGNGSNSTVGHGLGVAPSMIILKNRDDTDVWMVQHTSMGPTKYIILNRTDAEGTASTVWNNTAPTSSVFSIGTLADVNTNTEKYIAYCFAAVAGYSAFGSYTGNGSTDGPFVYTGFRPAFVLMKVTSTTDSWVIVDRTRSPYNVAKLTLFPNLSNAENDGAIEVDMLSNGFKLRTANSNVNASQTFIYAAFAESPFKFSLAR